MTKRPKPATAAVETPATEAADKPVVIATTVMPSENQGGGAPDAERISEDGITLSEAIKSDVATLADWEGAASGDARGGDGAAMTNNVPPTVVAAAERFANAYAAVKGPSQGRRRIGRRFGPEETTIPVAELTLDELIALDQDPDLVVTIHSLPE